MTMKSIFCLLLFVTFSLPLQAQPTRDRVLGNFEISEHPEAAVISVAFNFPVRYLSHFPARGGNELRIQLLPIAVARVDRDALFKRESYPPPGPNLAGITEVLYEGDTYSGLFLTLYFQNQARWEVGQGADYRSLQIRVLAPFPLQPGVKGAE